MYTIREAFPDDALTIRSLAERTWWDAYSPILEAAQIRYMLDDLYAEEKIRTQIQGSLQTYLLLFEGELPVAFAAYAPRNEAPEIYKLHKLYCLPQTQGKGYGKILISEVSARVLQAGSHILELNVNRSNKAKYFYGKMGFTIAREEDIPIGNYWMNDYVMRKEL